VGLLGDSLLDPLSYLMASEAAAGLSAQGGKKVNDVSLSNGEYEQFKEASFDPYVAVRDAYAQFRNRQIKDEGCGARFEVCRQQEPGGEYQEGLTASIGAGEPEVAAAENDQSGGEIGETAGGERFIVRVGVYVDPLNVQRQRDRLLRTGMAVDVVRYDRESYTLFGVEVPVGGGFAAAKLAEAELVQAGFPETVVVSH
ncbi:MAG: VacJ family lipoprotein, partial [Desulfobulbaceae bacterium]|nr:VacJ family lipoprotein [Desulfobulbaceae bacterium]